MPHPPPAPPARRWRLVARRAGRTVLACDCDTPGQAALLAAVLAVFWPGLAISCRRPATGAARAA